MFISAGLSILHLIATVVKWFSSYDLLLSGLDWFKSALSGMASDLIGSCVPINQVLVELG